MADRTDDRGVSAVVGFILVFGLVATAFTVYQGTVVPEQNRHAEIEHNRAVLGELLDLRNAIISTATTGQRQAASVTLGATYVRRPVAKNLGLSRGTIRTVDHGDSTISIDNAVAHDRDTAQYFDGRRHSFASKSIRYAPIYSFYSRAPLTRYENTVLINRFDEATVISAGQVLVDGRQITIIVLKGSVSHDQRDAVSFDITPISTSSNRVTVTNVSDERITITVPTRLRVSTWRELLADELGSDGYVSNVSTVAGSDAVAISMRPGVTYELSMAKVGIGDLTDEEAARYVVPVRGDGTGVPENGTQKLVVEVRDRFHNPVSGVTTTADLSTSEGSDTVSPHRATTDQSGRAAFTYFAPPTVDETTPAIVSVAVPPNGDATHTTNFSLRVLDSDGSGAGGS